MIGGEGGVIFGPKNVIAQQISFYFSLSFLVCLMEFSFGYSILFLLSIVLNYYFMRIANIWDIVPRQSRPKLYLWLYLSLILNKGFVIKKIYDLKTFQEHIKGLYHDLKDGKSRGKLVKRSDRQRKETRVTHFLKNYFRSGSLLLYYTPTQNHPENGHILNQNEYTCSNFKPQFSKSCNLTQFEHCSTCERIIVGKGH